MNKDNLKLITRKREDRAKRGRMELAFSKYPSLSVLGYIWTLCSIINQNEAVAHRQGTCLACDSGLSLRSAGNGYKPK